MIRLGVNIDHVATIRNARGGDHPDPVKAALMAVEAGADGITAHLREDRRHISDSDIERLSGGIDAPLNLEMAATPEMLAIALRHVPHACCLVPEKREELTTEGGLSLAGDRRRLEGCIKSLTAAGIRVSLFLDPEPDLMSQAAEIGAQVVELHTGSYCNARGKERAAVLKRLREAAEAGDEQGLEIHAGHGLTFDTLEPVAALPQVKELNIGHFLVGGGDFHRPDRCGGPDAGADGQGKAGMILGIGSDLVDIRRIERTLDRFGERFELRIFTETERRKAARRSGSAEARAASYARRFAAKEACSKALGTGLRKGVFWRDMGVENAASGRPEMRLTGGARRQLDSLTPAGMASRIDVTLADDHPFAQAVVVISAQPEGGAGR